MTYREYKKWAKEYLNEAQVLEEKIKKRRRRVYFESAEERERNERAIKQLYDMRSDCMTTYNLLMEKAREIKESGEDA